MKILIATQAVDTEDPALGFFVRWITELAKHHEHIEVICLKEGAHALPKNVRVHSLGKEKTTIYHSVFSRARYARRFLTLAWKLRHEYDTVFVHMNEEYVLIAGWLWELLGKRIYLWRNHAKGSWRTRYAGALSERVFYTSPNSYTASFTNANQMPVGIDTEYFIPGDTERHGVLMLGRLDPVKRVREMIDTARTAMKEIPFTLTMIGDATRKGSAYENEVMQSVAAIPGAKRISSIPHSATREYLRRAEVLLNFTPEGSFDKTIFEAASCGTLPLVTNTGLRGILPDECITSIEDAPRALVRLLCFPEADKARLRASCRESIVAHHSLTQLGNELAQAMRPREAILFQNGSIGDFLMFVHLSELLMESERFSHVTIVVPRNAVFLRGLIGEYPFLSVRQISSHNMLAALGLRGRMKTVLIHPTIGKIPLRVKLLAWLISRGRGSELIGFQDEGPLCSLYSITLPYDTGKPYIETVRDLARSADAHPDSKPPKLHFEGLQNVLTAQGLEEKKYIVFHPGASNPKRMFTVEDAAELVNFVLKKFPDTKIVLSGGPSERGYVEKIARASRAENLIAAVGASAGDIATIVKHAELFIGTDTGITHLACFLGTRVLEVAHNATANWLAFYAPNATVLYRLAGENETYSEQSYLAEHAKGVLKPFTTVPIQAVCEKIDRAL